jgi:enamine deaminase RidA (YjgF/YER057c/UK114 family)
VSFRHINPEGLHHNPAFSQAVVVEQPAKTIYIGGQNGVDADGKVVGPTVGEQTSQALRNLATILESEGASLANIVHWTIAVVDGQAFDEGFAAFQQVWNPATHRRPSRSTSSPAWVPSSWLRSTRSPSCDALGRATFEAGTRR